MRSALEVSKARASRPGAPAALTAVSVLRMATLNGARALGWEHQAGSLEAGKRADLVAVRLLSRLPVTASEEQLAEAAMGGEVGLTMVGGQVAFDGGEMPPEVLRGLEAVRAKLGMEGR
jgi:cytosine/adenosine deaminase-related metal-dependent hydrolase